MNRYLIVGPSGSGKTFVARAISARCGIPLVDLDSLFFNAGWTPSDNFKTFVSTWATEQSWAVAGSHPNVQDLLWARANVVVWLDLPRALTEYRVIRRSLSRWLRGVEVHSGCFEPSPIELGDHPIRGWLDVRHPVRSAWRKHPQYQAECAKRFSDSRWASVDRIRLRSTADISEFLAYMGSPSWWIRRSLGGEEWNTPRVQAAGA